MKAIFRMLLLLSVPISAIAQLHLPDSTLRAFRNASNDSLRYRANFSAYFYFEETNLDSALFYVNRMYLLARKNNEQMPMVLALDHKSYMLGSMGRYADALQCLLQAFRIAEDPKNDNQNWIANQQHSPEFNRLSLLSLTHHIFGGLLNRTQNTGQGIYHLKEARRIALAIGYPRRVFMADMNIGSAYVTINKLDSALTFLTDAKKMMIQSGVRKYLGSVLAAFGDVALKKGDKSGALQCYEQGISEALGQHNKIVLIGIYIKLTQFFLAEKQKDSSLYYATTTLKIFKTLGQIKSYNLNIGTVYENLYRSYKLGNQLDSAFRYAGLAVIAKDSVYQTSIATLARFQSLSLREQLRLQNLEKEKVIYQGKVRTYGLLSGLGVFIMVGLILYRSNRQKHKANLVLESTLKNLKITQTQLIQSEKMASLGELTAGVAHEIQNPLNFVNNFSEVSIELVDDMELELREGDKEEAINIAADIKQNLEKIIHHGKRADSIVKGMLQHSRASSSTKELTDINKLADEYLRLAFHGLRAKDKSFNAQLITSFVPSLPQINVVPQDIGRVLLNLFTNAFYSVHQKQKTALTGYVPIVELSTGMIRNTVTIKVKDNGLGIPDSIKDKIMQPFFTTKPSGEGTGLGLSLSYDIVVKGHDGKIEIDSKEGDYTEFTITIPI